MELKQTPNIVYQSQLETVQHSGSLTVTNNTPFSIALSVVEKSNPATHRVLLAQLSRPISELSDEELTRLCIGIEKRAWQFFGHNKKESVAHEMARELAYNFPNMGIEEVLIAVSMGMRGEIKGHTDFVHFSLKSLYLWLKSYRLETLAAANIEMNRIKANIERDTISEAPSRDVATKMAREIIESIAKRIEDGLSIYYHGLDELFLEAEELGIIGMPIEVKREIANSVASCISDDRAIFKSVCRTVSYMKVAHSIAGKPMDIIATTREVIRTKEAKVRSDIAEKAIKSNEEYKALAVEISNENI